MKKQNLFFDFDGMKFNTLPALVAYVNHRYEINTLPSEYIGNNETGQWYVNSNFIVSEKHPHGVAAKVDKNRNIIGYYGFSHRGGTLFKVGDKLFDEKWKLQCKEDWKNDFLISFFKGYQSNPEDSIPFKKRGSVTIKNLNQAEQAAINFSNYLS